MSPEIKGLFLSGGMSQRMGSDKAFLLYGAEPEIQRWRGIFAALDVDLYWSQRPGQYAPDQGPDIPRLPDATPGAGPLAAVLTAHQQFPACAWLVLACDWPLLGSLDIAHLLNARQVQKEATAYQIEGRREPLCTIYEPAFFRRYEPGEASLYRLLQAADVQDVQPIDPARFLNANDAITRHQAFQNLLHRNDR